jgi:hypothetical protein
MDKLTMSLMKLVRFTTDEQQHIEQESNEKEEGHREEYVLR